MNFHTKSTCSEVLRRCTPVSTTMSSFSEEEIRRMGVVQVSTPLSFNLIGHPLPRGLYDPALGPIDTQALCATCNNRAQWCPGHFGFIQLPVPVINPLFHRIVGNILRISCLSCHTILLSKGSKVLLTGQIKLLDKGLISQALNMSSSFPHLAQSKFDKGTELSAQMLSLAIAESYVQEALSDCPSQSLQVRGDGEYRTRFVKEAISSIRVGKRCPNCAQPLTRVTLLQNKILVPVTKVQVADKFSSKCAKPLVKELTSSNFSFMLPSECEKHLKAIWNNDADVLKAIVPALESNSGQHPIDLFFMKVVPVTPTLARPVCITNGQITEHPQNDVYKAILNDCLMLKSIVQVMNNDADNLSEDRKEVVEKLKGSTYNDKLQYAWQDLQVNVNTLLDIDAKRERHVAGIGLKQIIEKKEGIIRMNMMGKRVNYAARTVITPDPNLNIDEIGIPEVFAKQLTYPVPVTPWNAQDLRQLIQNGPDIHPGANFVEGEDGVIVRLDAKDLVQRESVAKRLLTPGDKKGIKILHRHLHNGDVLLLNRQPTLHRPSIMAHKARVLKGEKTFRLHYANCKSYNADFDGDEMNAHFPQNDVARSEAYNLVSVCNQYLVPKDGTPLSGLIQDHMVSGVRLSKRDTFFTRGTYMQLVFQALPFLEGDIKTLPPCIIKPVQLWSGKQVFSTVIINITPKGLPPLHLLSNAKIDYKAWYKSIPRVTQYGGMPLKNPQEMTEAEVVIRNGELLNGVLDKTHYGATPYSLVHCMYELYGGETSSKLLSSFSKLLTAFLQIEGFTLGVEDILVTKRADKKRSSIIKSIRHLGNQIITNVIDSSSGNLVDEVENAMKADPQFRNVLDREYKVSLDSYTNEINKTCLPAGLTVPFPENNLQLMVQSGAKGSTVNTMQISCLLGQIELEGKRPPLMISGKSLPSFPPYDPSPRAGGFVDGRFMTGIQPQEFFFHCMAGREGLIDTAVKTSRSGYLQRCLVKHLEGLSVQYDMTVRDSDGSLIQYAYGEDGMEISKSQYLKEKLLPFLIDNIKVVYNEHSFKQIKDQNYELVKKYCKKIKSCNKPLPSQKRRTSGFIHFAEEKKNELDIKRKINKKSGRTTLTEELCRQWASLDPDTKKKYKKKSNVLPDPVVSKYPPDRNFGSIPETLETLIDNYCKKNRGVISKDELRVVMSQKAMTSLCPPGEPVGLLAAQSIGEPSTQMTLNTFHFAGRGEMNVTLGIPRLREILMVASRNIKTPAVDVPFKMETPKLEKRAEKLRRHLMKVTLADILESVEVTETFEISPLPLQVYTLKMNFLKRAEYRDDTDVTPKQILTHIEKKFLRQLTGYLRAKKKKEIRELISSEGAASDGGKSKHQEDADIDNYENDPVAEKPAKMKAGTMENYESSDDEPIGDDDDATIERRRARHQEEQQYSDLEDEVEEVQIELGNEEEDEEWNNEATEEKQEDKRGIDAEEESNRKSLVLEQDCVMDYKFDTLKQEWCEVKLGYSLDMGRIDFATKFKYMATHSVIKEVPGIKRAFILTNDQGHKVLRTDGINVREMYNNSHILDINKLYTNDIYIMSQIYGIEAASKVLVKEIQQVFKVYGITVDCRHLSLVADYMMFSGVYLPLSRTGMEGATSPLQQMSFESCLTFLKNAVLRNKKDDLRSPSSRLMIGLPCQSGTGAFDLIHKITI